MTPIHTSFGFENEVPVAGFRWGWMKDEKVKGVFAERQIPFWPPPTEPVLIEEKPIAAPGALLIDNTEAEKFDPSQRRLVRPDENPALFREFAELDPNDLVSLLKFANSYGCLGIPRWANWPPKKGKSGLSALILIDRPIRVEIQADWERSIHLLRLAAILFDYLSSRDVSGVRKFIRWGQVDIPTPYSPLEQWHCDTHPDLPPTKFLFERVREWIFFPRASSHDDPIEVGWTWLIRVVNRQLSSLASPVLELDEHGRDGSFPIVERILPSTLHSALWAQMYRAIAGGNVFRKCKNCNRWYVISGRDAVDNGSRNTVRKLYCGSVCRVQNSRKKQARVVELHNAGRKPRDIAADLGTDLAVIKKWLSKSK